MLYSPYNQRKTRDDLAFLGSQGRGGGAPSALSHLMCSKEATSAPNDVRLFQRSNALSARHLAGHQTQVQLPTLEPASWGCEADFAQATETPPPSPGQQLSLPSGAADKQPQNVTLQGLRNEWAVDEASDFAEKYSLHTPKPGRPACRHGERCLPRTQVLGEHLSLKVTGIRLQLYDLIDPSWSA